MCKYLAKVNDVTNLDALLRQLIDERRTEGTWVGADWPYLTSWLVMVMFALTESTSAAVIFDLQKVLPLSS
jgi:hypothetical protein